jgi:hypothetical protein
MKRLYGEIKETGEGNEFKYDSIWYIARTFVNDKMYPTPSTTVTNIKKQTSLFKKSVMWTQNKRLYSFYYQR